MAADFFRMSGELDPVAGQEGVAGGKQRPVLGRLPRRGCRHGQRNQNRRKYRPPPCCHERTYVFSDFGEIPPS